ncbi:formylglycine-generating enzyme family protein [Monashia sp. NPDC004114]
MTTASAHDVHMCLVPAGTLRQGSMHSPDEQPIREVYLDAFQIDRDPVSNRQFAEFIADGGYTTAPLWTPAGWEFVQANRITAPTYWEDPLWATDPDVPVTGVSWWEALAFARWGDKTLPSEAQWEFACRGPAGRTYPWGEQLPTLDRANYAPDCEPTERRPTRPDAHPTNVSPCGCRDMVGNLAEWCLDNYAVGYVGRPDRNPLHLVDEYQPHVVRGGSGLHDADYLRGSARDNYHPGLRDNLIGFRCLRPLQEAHG